jgi:hypothetical protein
MQFPRWAGSFAPQKRVPFFIHIDEFQGVAPCIALSAPQAAGIRMRSWRR